MKKDEFYLLCATVYAVGAMVAAGVHWGAFATGMVWFIGCALKAHWQAQDVSQ